MESKKEEDLLMNHEYDGIKELDNDLPPWWINLFYITIIFGVIYLLGYEVFGWYRQPDQEYQAEVTYWEKNAVQEESAALGHVDPVVEAKKGEKVYQVHCFTCHGKNGEGLVGPNLTDKYWILGGSFEDVYKTIAKGGRPDKGMQAWLNQLGKSKINQLVYFIESIQNTNPANGKGPEGKLYEPLDSSVPLKAMTDLVDLEKGKDAYEQYCSACHGIDLNGGFAKSLLDDEWLHGKGELQDLMKIINEGDLPNNMPPWSEVLTPVEVLKISSYILDKRNKR